MPKMLVIAACLINLGDDAGGVSHEVGDMPEVPKDTAKLLAENDRVLYVNEKDDHTKPARFTASERMVKAAEAMRKEAAKAAKATEATE